jgi:hypothetical protein
MNCISGLVAGNTLSLMLVEDSFPRLVGDFVVFVIWDNFVSTRSNPLLLRHRKPFTTFWTPLLPTFSPRLAIWPRLLLAVPEIQLFRA